MKETKSSQVFTLISFGTMRQGSALTLAPVFTLKLQAILWELLPLPMKQLNINFYLVLLIP